MAAKNTDAQVVTSVDTDLTYGYLTIRSQLQSGRRFANLVHLAKDTSLYEGQSMWLRCSLQESRGKGSIGFALLRSKGETIQGILDGTAGGIDKKVVKWVAKLPLESVLDVYGGFVTAVKPVEAASIQTCEIRVERVFCINRSSPELPFLLRDASAHENDSMCNVGQDVRLDHRVLDLRTAANRNIFKVQASVCKFFREFLDKSGFTEIHTPKLMSGFAEGGTSVFKLKYFNQDACLAQSPQLHKQMAICAGLDRVYEIGPVFRAENSNTHRHLCEFTGLDFEMEIYDHYSEILDVVENLFKSIFERLTQECARHIEAVKAQYPADPFVWSETTPRFPFSEAVEMLRQAGEPDIPSDISNFDLTTTMEKKLGELVKTKYHTDFFMVTKYPLGVRPFYTMPDPNDPTLSNSYDVFMRGEEIISGAQRVHEPDLLLARAQSFGVNPASIQAYLDAMKLGAPPHGGVGVGLERVVMLFLGLNNIRKTSMFPRDPKRLSP